MYEDEYGSKEKETEFLGHVLRVSREHHRAPALTWTPMGKRKVGRLKKTWLRTVDKERAVAGWKSWEETRPLAKALCATQREEDDRLGEVVASLRKPKRGKTFLGTVSAHSEGLSLCLLNASLTL